MAKKIEQKVADTILQKPHKVSIGGRDYLVPPPTIGTLIEVSSMLSEIPQMEFKSDDIIGCVLRYAKDSDKLTDICALLMLGLKKANKRTFGFFGPTRLEYLSKIIKLTATVEETAIAITEIISGLGIKDFFDISIFLQSLNVTKPTKMEKTSQTVSGQS